VGGVLAYMIQGVNVVIPAHYHGSTVGVTLAFMGLAYVLLPQLGFGEVEGGMARWQPYVYGGGQLIHVLGLAWSGGYGVQRKVAGAEQALTTLPQKIGMGMMGLGGADRGDRRHHVRPGLPQADGAAPALRRRLEELDRRLRAGRLRWAIKTGARSPRFHCCDAARLNTRRAACCGR
jgi:hypothetical protein